MTGPTRPSDEAITAMLEDRVAAPAPDDLRSVVLARVLEARNKDRRRRWRTGRNGTLLIAAALAMAGAVGLASLAGSRPQPAPTALPAVVEPSLPVGPTTEASPLAQGTVCAYFDGIARNGGEGSGAEPVPGPAPAEAANGPVILLSGGDRAELAEPHLLDPFGDPPSPELAADWGLDSLAVSGWNPSADGTVVAAELSSYECANEVFVMRIDGSGLRRPFAASDVSVFSPAWSSDGTRLAVVTAPWSATQRSANPVPSSLLLWNPATGESEDLGRPCERCSPVGEQDGHGALAWSPDGSRIAVDYTDLSCGLETPAPDPETACRGIAVVSRDGAWDPVAVADDGSGAVPGLVGWLDDNTLLAQRGEGLLRVDLTSGDAISLPSSVNAPMWSVSRALSPDRTKVISARGGNEAFMTVQDVMTGETTRVEPIPPDVLDFVWSPDSAWVLAIADTDGFGANMGLYLGRTDGSEPAHQVLPGGFGNMAWLEAAR